MNSSLKRCGRLASHSSEEACDNPLSRFLTLLDFKHTNDRKLDLVLEAFGSRIFSHFYNYPLPSFKMTISRHILCPLEQSHLNKIYLVSKQYSSQNVLYNQISNKTIFKNNNYNYNNNL